MSRAVLGALWLALLGCTEGLDPAGLVRTPRILAIVAEPPDVPPGTDLSFTAMISVPASVPGPVRMRWSACLDEQTVLSETGLPAAPGVDEPTSCDPVQLDPGVPFVVSGARTLAMLEMLATSTHLGDDDATRRMRVGGIVASIGFVFLARLELVDAEGHTLVEGYKRAVVRLPLVFPTTTNPPPPVFAIDGLSVAATGEPFVCASLGPLSVTADTDVELAPILLGDEEPWLEEYVALDYSAGLSRQREGAYYSWFVSAGPGDRNHAGTLSPETTRRPDRRATWHTPSEPGGYSVWLVVRDGHLGTSACRADVTVAASPPAL